MLEHRRHLPPDPTIPSPKAEPFKRWLARVGYERIQEIEDPEIAIKRTRAIYQAKGYSADWIEKRMRSIAIRDELTGEWKKRGVREQREYANLAAEISKAAFGLTPKEYAEFKRLKRENLRDRSGGHPACRRGRASCRPETTLAILRFQNLRMTLENSCASSAGLEARLYGRQDARRHNGNARCKLEKKSPRSAAACFMIHRI